MTLYFYILQKPFGDKPYIQFSECDVDEKPKTYRPITKFPSGYYNCFVRKEDIGHLCGYGNDTLILTEKNNALAKKIFSNSLEGVVKNLQDKISKYKELLDSIAEFKED